MFGEGGYYKAVVVVRGLCETFDEVGAEPCGRNCFFCGCFFVDPC